MEQIIEIKKFFPATVASRKAIEVLKKEMPLTRDFSYIFDFSGIDFISRSFADELFHFITDKNISIEFVNANSNILEMFKAVQKNGRKKSFHTIAVIPFSEKEEISNFLSLI